MNDLPGSRPHYQPILDALPDSLHAVILPKLKEWDAGVQQKIADVRKEFDGLEAYKKLAENNIDPNYAEQAIILADQLQRDPKGTVTQLNEAWSLGLVDGSAVTTDPVEELDDEWETNEDIMKNPKVKAMYESLNQLQSEFDNRKTQEEQDAQIEAFEASLDELEEVNKQNNLPFNRMFVTALMSQGLDGEAAVKEYHAILAGTVKTDEPPATTDTNNEPPVVLGGNGTGSGSPDGTVNFGSMSKNDLNSTVEQMIQAQLNSNQG